MLDLTKKSGFFPIVGVLCAAICAPVWAQSLSFAGDTASYHGYMQTLAQLWDEKGRGTILMQQVPTTLAIRKAATGEVTLGGMARTTRPADRQERQVAVFPIAWDALVVIVHPSNRIANLRLQELADLYRGKISDWAQLGGAGGAILTLAHEGPLHGLDVTLADLLLRDPTANLIATQRFATTDELIAMVERSPSAVAVVNYSRARRASVRLLQVEGQAASPASIQNGDYLLYFPLYLGVRSGSQNSRNIRDFLRFAASADARRVLRRNGVVPYPDGVGLTSRQMERAGLLDGLRTDG